MIADASRRTYLANERTYLAWWRTGVTALATGIAVGRIVPTVSHQGRLPYAILGAGFALIGIAAVAYGLVRESQVRQALQRGRYVAADEKVLVGLTVSACVLGVFGLVLVFVGT